MIEGTSQARKETTAANQYESSTHLIFPKDKIAYRSRSRDEQDTENIRQWF